MIRRKNNKVKLYEVEGYVTSGIVLGMFAELSRRQFIYAAKNKLHAQWLAWKDGITKPQIVSSRGKTPENPIYDRDGKQKIFGRLPCIVNVEGMSSEGQKITRDYVVRDFRPGEDAVYLSKLENYDLFSARRIEPTHEPLDPRLIKHLQESTM